MNTNTGTRWSSTKKYVDLETGEEIRKRTMKETILEVKRKWIIIKITKRYETNRNKTHGTIEYSIECRRNRQQEIQFN